MEGNTEKLSYKEIVEKYRNFLTDSEIKELENKGSGFLKEHEEKYKNQMYQDFMNMILFGEYKTNKYYYSQNELEKMNKFEKDEK